MDLTDYTPPPTPDVPIPVPGMYKSCEDMPMYNYIRCVVYNDRAHLLHVYDKREAIVHANELEAAWESIEGEYMQLIEESIDAYALSLYYELESLIILNQVVKHCTEIMSVYRVKDLATVLRKAGFDFQFDASDDAAYEKDLMRVFKRQKKIIFDIEDAEKKLKKARKDVKITVPFFDNILTNLSKFMGSHVDERQITVSRYATILNAYTQYVENLKIQANAGPGKDR